MWKKNNLLLYQLRIFYLNSKLFTVSKLQLWESLSYAATSQVLYLLFPLKLWIISTICLISNFIWWTCAKLLKEMRNFPLSTVFICKKIQKLLSLNIFQNMLKIQFCHKCQMLISITWHMKRQNDTSHIWFKKHIHDYG